MRRRFLSLSSRAAQIVGRLRADEGPVGFGVRVSLLSLRQQSRTQIGLSAAGVAFWFVIALFPALIATLSILGLFLDPAEIGQVARQVNDVTPGSLSVAVLKQVQSAASSEPSTLSLSFLVAVAASAWSASVGVYNLARGVRVAYGVPPRRYVSARARAFAASVAVSVGVAVVVTVAAFTAQWIAGFSGLVRLLATVTGVAVAFVACVALLVLVYAFGAGRLRVSGFGIRVFPGALASALALTVVYLALGTALQFASGYQAVYGAVAGVVIVMLVAYTSSYIVLLGADVNSQWDEARSP